MGELSRAEISLKLAENFSSGGNSLIDACRQELPHIKVFKKKEPAKAPSPTHGENGDLKGASSLVKLVETKEKGRFIVANNEVKTGDLFMRPSYYIKK